MARGWPIGGSADRPRFVVHRQCTSAANRFHLQALKFARRKILRVGATKPSNHPFFANSRDADVIRLHQQTGLPVMVRKPNELERDHDNVYQLGTSRQRAVSRKPD